MKNELMPFAEMKVKTIEFYRSLGIGNIPEDKVKDAVASLTMPQYAKQYNDKNDDIINNNGALATLGDAVCGALLLTKKYRYNSTKKELTFKKKLLTNDNLNEKGKSLLKEKLFHKNNDLNENNKKSYATAFEAVIGFLSLVDIKITEGVFTTYID